MNINPQSTRQSEPTHRHMDGILCDIVSLSNS